MKQINITDDIITGEYSNAVNIFHTKEEFFIDFLLMNYKSGYVVQRIIVSPECAQRLMEALDENIKKYKKQKI